MDSTIPQQQTPSRKSADIQKAELERKSRNLYKIFNPTNQTHQIVLNAAISPEVWTCEAKSEAVVPWYVAEKYFDEMTTKIITAKSDKAIISENEKRRERGFPAMDLHTEQFRFESRNLKTMMGKREQIVKILNRGLYKEYGIGGEEIQQIDKRDRKATFDPGIDVLGSPTQGLPTESVSIPSKEEDYVEPSKELESNTTEELETKIEEEADELEVPTHIVKKGKK